MAELVVRLAPDCYVTWSRTVDAPTTGVLGRAPMAQHLHEQRGLTTEDAASLLVVVDSNGTSDPTVTIDDVVRSNRAGPNEIALSLEQIIEQYG
jgi:hypothetical protein